MSISGVTAEVQFKSHPAGYYPMRDLNEDYYICNWPLYHQEKALSSKQCYNGSWSRSAVDEFSGSDKDVVKQTIIEHEAVFKNQVYELHRLYRVQRGLKDEIKKKELQIGQISADTESSPLPFQLTSEDAQKWHLSSFRGSSSCYGLPSISHTKGIPLNSPEGTSTRGSPFVHQHGGSSKLKEVLDCRPTKVRRKLFDLQLPADQYIDDDEPEQIKNENGSLSCDIPCQGSRIVAGSSASLSYGGYAGIYTDSAGSDLRINSRNVADLNEPIQIEDMNASSTFVHTDHLFSEREIRSQELFMKAKPKILGFLDQKAPNSICQNSSRSSNAHVNSKNDGGLSLHVLKQGQDKVDLQPVSQTLQWEKFCLSSQPMQSSFEKSCDSAANLLTDQAVMGDSRERTNCGIVISESSKNSELTFASDSPNRHKIARLCDSGNFRRSGSSSDNLSNSLSQKSMLVEGLPSLDSYRTPRKDSQTAAQSHGSFGSRWHDSNASLSPGHQNLPTQNGFHHELFSRSEKASVCIPIISHDSHDHASGHVASEHLHTRKHTNCVPVDSDREIKQNLVLSRGSIHKSTSPDSVAIKNGESTQKEALLVPHWLRVMPAIEREKNSGIDLNHREMSFAQSSSCHLSSKVEGGNGLSQTLSQCMESFSPLCKVESKRKEIGEGPHRKIFGFPIFLNPPTLENAFSPLASPSISITEESKCEVTEHKREVRMFDINLPCDPISEWSEVAAEETVDLEKKSSTKSTYLKQQFDLNSCVLDDETFMKPSVPSVVEKVIVEIDLEAPPVLETEEDSFQGEEIPQKPLEKSIPVTQQETEHSLEILDRMAAEAIVAISIVGFTNCLDSTAQDIPEEASLDCLNWFAGMVVSFEDNSPWTRSEGAPRDCEEQNVEESTSESIDYFESMTLRQVEMGEDEYLPEPLIPETPRAEDVVVTPASNRPRRGQARRGRQRRDFQRDILPGLASLSRHEVTEDLQTFGGLMRAMGYSWHTGSTRRNSSRIVSSRGRERLAIGSPAAVLDAIGSPTMHQKNTVEVGLEDRTPTVWGNTPRRPRRQRCAAGNPPLHAPST